MLEMFHRDLDHKKPDRHSRLWVNEWGLTEEMRHFLKLLIDTENVPRPKLNSHVFQSWDTRFLSRPPKVSYLSFHSSKKKVEEDKKKKTIKVTSFVIFPIINSL